MADPDPQPSEMPSIPPKGRPRKPDALTPAERSRMYRDRLKADGLKEVKCFLEPAHLFYLEAMCKIHGVTIGEAISLALTSLVRGESPPAPRAEGIVLPSSGLILLDDR